MLGRLRILIQNRNANIGAPEEGNSSGLERGLKASSQTLSRSGQRMAVHRTQTASLESKSPEKPPTKLWGFQFCKAKGDVSKGDGENIRTLWDCCRNCKISPQGSVPPERKRQLESCSKADRLDVHSRNTRHSAVTNITNGSSSGSNSAVSSADTLDSTIHSFPSFQSQQASIMDMEAIINMMEYAHAGEKKYMDNNEDNISFLRAISTSCMAAQQSGQDTLDLPYTKAELTEALVMVMETLPIHSVPSFILPCSMLAVYNLSKIKPPLDSEQESGVLRLALHGVLSMETAKGDSHSQALYKSSSDTMEAMLKGLLSEAPTTSHLLFILQHINFWLHSQDMQERSRAIKCCTSFLRHAVRIPDFDKSGELPHALGHQVAQFGICIMDTVEDVSHQAREAIKCLYQLLLHQMGLSTREAGELWCHKSEDKKMLAYMDTCRVGELFGKIFTEDQKRAFLQTSLLAVYDPLMRISEAGILLVYSLLGKTNELMDDTAEEVEQKIYHQLHKLRILREVPEALQSIIPSKVDVILKNKKN